MSKEEKALEVAQKGEKIYKKLAEKLRKKYPPNFYVAIEPNTGDFFVGYDSVQVLKEARRKYPRRTFFGAHVGYLAGRI